MDGYAAERNVIAFAPRAPARAGALAFAACFTPHDRMDISDWRDALKAAGYDRMIIHNRDNGDALEVGNFLSVYRRGQSWSRWGFARQGRLINSWCCLTSMDMGQFDTMRDAFCAVLGGLAGQAGGMMVPGGRGAVVTELAARRRAATAA